LMVLVIPIIEVKKTRPYPFDTLNSWNAHHPQLLEGMTLSRQSFQNNQENACMVIYYQFPALFVPPTLTSLTS
jgi:hypothetical protein